MVSRRAWVRAIPVLWAWLCPLVAFAEAPQGAPGSSSDAGVESPDEEVLSERAAQLRALTRGRLAEEVDADAVLRWPLVDGPFSPELLQQAERPPAKRDPDASKAERAFVSALARFLALPEGRRARLLAQHRRKHEAHEAAQRRLERLGERLTRLSAENDAIEAWLAGELSPENDVRPLLRVDLVPPELPPRADESARVLREGLRAAYATRDALIARYLALPEEEREALHEAQRLEREQAREQAQRATAQAERAREAEAARASVETDEQTERMAREREAALQTASEGGSEAQRFFARERVRLLDHQEALVRVEKELGVDAQSVEQPRERALGFQRRVQEILGRSVLDVHREQDADRLYGELRQALEGGRDELRNTLRRWRNDDTRVPELGPGADTSLLGDQARGELRELENELRKSGEALRAEEAELLRAHARVLRDSIGRMNEARLSLLDQTTSELRTGLLGFGPEGVAQTRRELDLLALGLQYHLWMLPHDVQRMMSGAKNASLSIVLALIQFVLGVIVFRWWRAHGDESLALIEQRAREVPLQTWFTRGLSLWAWYGRRVRTPLEWLLLFWLIFHVIGRIEALPEIAFVRLAVLWITIGWAAVLFLDALAARQRMLYRHGYESPELRLKSLRTVALLVVATGLVLAWADEGVGQGTVYRWVQVVCFLSAIPVVLLLLYWWREPVRERLVEVSEEHVVVRWALRWRSGWQCYPVTLVGAAYLIWQGLFRFLMREAARFEWMQRALAYVFRTQVQRQAQAQRSQDKAPLRDDEAPSLKPGAPAPEWIPEVARGQLDRAVEQVTVGSSLTIVVGERGLGRTAFLRRLGEEAGANAALYVRCPVGGLEAFEAELQKQACAFSGADPSSSSMEALAGSPVRVVCVDDVQRVVRPAVGGLDAFERLVDLAQQHDARIAWVFSVTASAWAIVSRARESASGFDCVVRLSAWSDRQIARLLSTRSEAEGLSPSFDDLVVPRQLDVEETEDPARRTEIAYYRILWDYSNGNPSVALYFWRQSLFRVDDATVVVNLFEAPRPREIEELAPALHFMLRAVVQLDRATPQAVAECTALPLEDVRDGLELALRRGYLERAGDEVIVAMSWFRTVTTVLRRQHLLLT